MSPRFHTYEIIKYDFSVESYFSTKENGRYIIMLSITPNITYEFYRTETLLYIKGCNEAQQEKILCGIVTICRNKDSDQLRDNRKSDQLPYFRYL